MSSGTAAARRPASRRAAAALLALGVLLAGALVVPGPARAQLLEPADAAELANVLADATEEQDVCYEWTVFIDDQDTGRTAVDRGSNAGPGGVLVGCTNTVTLEASITYTCGSCESEDSAALDVRSTVPGVDEDGLERLGFSASDLLGDEDDLALFNMVSALPLLVAEATGKGVPVETPASIPAQDRLTGDPGSDALREQWPWLVLWGGVALYAPIYLLRARGRENKRRTSSA